MSMSGLSRSDLWTLTTYRSCDVIKIKISPSSLLILSLESTLLACFRISLFLQVSNALASASMHRCFVMTYYVRNIICYHRCAISCTTQHNTTKKARKGRTCENCTPLTHLYTLLVLGNYIIRGAMQLITLAQEEIYAHTHHT